MHKNDEQIAIRDRFVLLLVLVNAVAIRSGFTSNPKWYKVSLFCIPLLIISILASRRKRTSGY
ncbi:MAG: hypothetical protein J7527_06560 [Chitinophagaceae bacterium]|nr:hypothetical protein [Chitinophagaceae bacterium]